MSEWYEAKAEDIDIDYEDKEVGFFVHSTDCGNVYLTLSFEQIKEIASKIDKEEPKP